MKALEQHEVAEMNLLDQYRKSKVLDDLIFGGGTMLRLCFDLQRFSVDLDFYAAKHDQDRLKALNTKLPLAFEALGGAVREHQDKHHSLLIEGNVPQSSRRLKVEVRKSLSKAPKTQIGVAHSAFTNLQVRLTILTLEQMWHNKIAALLDRGEIRDAYDLEFLSQRQAGQFKTLSLDKLQGLHRALESFTDQAFRVTLGSVLSKEERLAVLGHRFSYLRSKIAAELAKR